MGDMEHKCPCCGAAVTEDEAVAIDKLRAIVADWNLYAAPLGFAKVTKLTARRVRTLRLAIKERPDLRDWTRAIRAYAADVKRWPERVKYGFDTFIRPSVRDRWFEIAPGEDPNGMSEEEADAFYTKDFK